MDLVKDPALARPAGRRPPRAWRRASAALAVLLLLAGGGYYAWQRGTTPADARSRLPIATVELGDLEDTVTATGTLQPRDYVDVGTQVSGQLRKLHVEIGSAVKSGQLLAELDPTVYETRVDANRAQLRTLQAQLADRQAQLRLAELQFRRQTNLMREQATSRDALETAEAALHSARAQIEVLNSQIQQTRSTLRGDEANLGYTRIRAPMAGTVVAQSAKQGQTLNANQQAPVIVRIADLSTMTVQAQVSEADVGQLRPGMDVYFKTLGNQEQRWYGRLRQINPTPEIVNNVVLFSALFDVENRDGLLLPQMTAQVYFVTAQAKDAVLVPVTALSPVRNASPDGERRARVARREVSGQAVDPRARYANRPAMVRVVGSNGAIEERIVRVGVTTRVTAQIVSGLEPGERVISGQRTAPPQRPRAEGGAPRMMPRL
jgi:membrane fusion protein, macrolide-specific efflux system